MNIYLPKIQAVCGQTIAIAGSKSETNRMLLLQAIFPEIWLENGSVSDDSAVMQQAVQSLDATIDVHHAGTAMRFLTAYFSVLENREVTLTGSPRMKQRPIGILVDALRKLGAQIDYLENEGFPPLKITGKKLAGGKVMLQANVSSQFISALLLIAPKLENGIEVTLAGDITSMPYIRMTLSLLHEIGINTDFDFNRISILPGRAATPKTLWIESDWSSASYFYSIIALSPPGTTITLTHFSGNSLQGDSALARIYETFGVKTVFSENAITLTRLDCRPEAISLNLNDTPDLAQTIAVTCLGLGIGCTLSGLHTLRIKETDRLEALRNELGKLGAKIAITHESLALEPSAQLNPNVAIATYNDHRMAMAFAPLALKTPITICDAGVVSKSYPGFWEDLRRIGFEQQPLSLGE